MTRKLFALLAFLGCSALLSAAENPLVIQTDFGTKDGAVAAMRGVAVGVSRQIQIYDLSQDNTPYDIWEGAYRLKQAAPFWPAGTVFVSVIDPGVGTERRAIVLKTRSGHYFIGPDNGTWTLIAEDLGVAEVREIDETRNRRPGSERSYTFHGRDIFAYVGARLAAGVITFAEVGPVLPPDSMVMLKYEKPRLENGVLIGTIPTLDFQYGNIWTNIDETLFKRLNPKFGEKLRVTISRGGQPVFSGDLPYEKTFGDVPEGAPVLYLNSLLNVAVALNMGSFAEKHGVKSGGGMERARGANRPVKVFVATIAFAIAATAAAARVNLVDPSPNDAYSPSQPISALLQDAGSGDPESGGCGCVRSDGTQFHEGIDIKPALPRDRQGEPTDPVFAAMDGVVRYVNPTAGDSTYGRYIVIEHPDATPAVYTLYAHLSRIGVGIQPGSRVTAGQTIGVMGHSSGGYTIPKDRAHVHFEIGLWVTKDFQAWYDRQKFGSKNEHGLWNGMNLMGFDPLDFIRQYRARRVDDFREYIAGMETAARVRIATTKVPDFAQRYPSLLTKEIPPLVAGWDIKFSWSGIPIALTPLTAAEVAGLARNKPQIVDVNAGIESRYKCKTLAVKRGKTWTIGKDLQTVLGQMFGI